VLIWRSCRRLRTSGPRRSSTWWGQVNTTSRSRILTYSMSSFPGGMTYWARLRLGTLPHMLGPRSEPLVRWGGRSHAASGTGGVPHQNPPRLLPLSGAGQLCPTDTGTVPSIQSGNRRRRKLIREWTRLSGRVTVQKRTTFQAFGERISTCGNNYSV